MNYLGRLLERRGRPLFGCLAPHFTITVMWDRTRFLNLFSETPKSLRNFRLLQFSKFAHRYLHTRSNHLEMWRSRSGWMRYNVIGERDIACIGWFRPICASLILVYDRSFHAFGSWAAWAENCTHATHVLRKPLSHRYPAPDSLRRLGLRMHNSKLGVQMNQFVVPENRFGGIGSRRGYADLGE